MSITGNHTVTPSDLRLVNREGKNFQEPSFGRCPGYLQTNMAIIPEDYASDFESFCHRNSSACPLVYKSATGEVGSTLLAENSDIRTDLSAYKVYKKGSFTESLADLTSYPWKNMVSFYLGCSFSFDNKLIESGIKRKNVDKNVAMYITNIECETVGVFSTKMVVSMRPIPQDKLLTAVKVTINADFAHGAPIHIGRPQDIGIADLNKPDFGHSCEIQEDEIPVFWACGVTSSMALLAAKLPICFSHSPGCMFVADVLSDDVPNIVKTSLYPNPLVICLDKTSQCYSIASNHSYEVLSRIEKETYEDPGKRGIKDLVVKDDFQKACLSLAKYSSHVGIALGFPCNENCIPEEENDGIAGAIYIAKVLIYLDKQVTFLVDNSSTVLIETLKKCFSKRFFQKMPEFANVNHDLLLEDTSFVFDSVKKHPKFSHLIAIERPSPSQTGKYFTMTGRDLSDKCDPIDILFEQANSIDGITTIGIGDGGNEIGMGKVADKVADFICNGKLIAATVSCDYLITSGVSNWGGLAIASGLFALRKCPIHSRYQRDGIRLNDEQLNINDFLMTESEDLALHKFILEQGFRDGITAMPTLTVDNLSYDNVHAPKLQKYRELVMV